MTTVQGVQHQDWQQAPPTFISVHRVSEMMDRSMQHVTRALPEHLTTVEATFKQYGAEAFFAIPNGTSISDTARFEVYVGPAVDLRKLNTLCVENGYISARPAVQYIDCGLWEEDDEDTNEE